MYVAPGCRGRVRIDASRGAAQGPCEHGQGAPRPERVLLGQAARNGRVHEAVEHGTGYRESHVRPAHDGHTTLFGICGDGFAPFKGFAEEAKAFIGKRAQEGLFVSEVSIGRGFGHTCFFGEGSEAESIGALAFQGLKAEAEEFGAQVPVMVAIVLFQDIPPSFIVLSTTPNFAYVVLLNARLQLYFTLLSQKWEKEQFRCCHCQHF